VHLVLWEIGFVIFEDFGLLVVDIGKSLAVVGVVVVEIGFDLDSLDIGVVVVVVVEFG